MRHSMANAHVFRILFNTILFINLLRTSELPCLRRAACGDFVSAESPCGRLELLNLAYFGNVFTLDKYCKQKLTNDFSYRSKNKIK